MKKVGSTKLKNSLPYYLQLVAAGTRLLITDRGHPLAKLVPVDDKGGESSMDELISEAVFTGRLTDCSEEGLSRLRKKPKSTIKIPHVSVADLLISDRE